MRLQLNKAVGLLALALIVVVTAVFAFVWNIIPAFILLAIVGAGFGALLTIFGIPFNIAWIIATVLIWVALLWNSVVVDNLPKNQSED